MRRHSPISCQLWRTLSECFFTFFRVHVIFCSIVNGAPVTASPKSHIFTLLVYYTILFSHTIDIFLKALLEKWCTRKPVIFVLNKPRYCYFLLCCYVLWCTCSLLIIQSPVLPILSESSVAYTHTLCFDITNIGYR